MTNKEATMILNGNFLKADSNGEPPADLSFSEVFELALKAIEITKVESCVGCAFEMLDEWKDPCRICRRNLKDYYREAEKHED